MDYRSIIESSYNRHNWLELLNDIFHHNVEFRQEPLSVPVDKDMAKSCRIVSLSNVIGLLYVICL